MSSDQRKQLMTKDYLMETLRASIDAEQKKAPER
jgi:hypothetical protein